MPSSLFQGGPYDGQIREVPHPTEGYDTSVWSIPVAADISGLTAGEIAERYRDPYQKRTVKRAIYMLLGTTYQLTTHGCGKYQQYVYVRTTEERI